MHVLCVEGEAVGQSVTGNKQLIHSGLIAKGSRAFSLTRTSIDQFLMYMLNEGIGIYIFFLSEREKERLGDVVPRFCSYTVVTFLCVCCPTLALPPLSVTGSNT